MKEELHPEVELGGPGAVVQEAVVPESDRVTVTCQYCKMCATRGSQAKADAWLEKHEMFCARNPNRKVEDPGPSSEPDLDATVDEPETKGTTALSIGTDFPDEREFTAARVEKYVQNRGSFYKAAGGQEVPDSAAMSMYALDKCKISTETIVIEKDSDQAKATVRGYRGGVSVDASVILRFDVLRRRELLKMAKKYPKAILEWSDQMMPRLDLNYMLTDRTPMITLGEHVINFAIDQEQFAERTAETLARRRVFDMLSGVDWRTQAETQVEDDDSAAVGSSKKVIG